MGCAITPPNNVVVVVVGNFGGFCVALVFEPLFVSVRVLKVPPKLNDFGALFV